MKPEQTFLVLLKVELQNGHIVENDDCLSWVISQFEAFIERLFVVLQSQDLFSSVMVEICYHGLDLAADEGVSTWFFGVHQSLEY